MYLLILQRGRGRGGERKKEMRERNIDWLPHVYTLTRDGTCKLGMCPDWELNPQPFGVWDDAPTN